MPREKIVSLSPVDIRSAEGAAREVLERARAQVGFIPNMYACMANQPALLDTYLHGYRLFREQTQLSPAEQEVIFLAISRDNGCEYCVSAHSMLAAQKSGVTPECLRALRDGTALPDRQLEALARMTRHLLATRGNPEREELRRFIEAGYDERALLAIVLAIAVKTLSNYSNHLFATPLDAPFANYAWPEPAAAAG